MKTILSLREAVLIIALLLVPVLSAQALEPADQAPAWVEPLTLRLEQLADSLSRHIKPWPVPNRTFRVERYGAKGDGTTLNTRAIQAAVDACSAKGGGVVLFSKGDYLTGTIRLKSGVMLEVAEGARILGSTDINDYPEMVEQMKSIMSEYYVFRQSLIYAEGAQRVGIRGKGEIYFRGEKCNFASAETIGQIKDRPLGIRMIACTDVVLQDIFLHNSAAWMQNYLACRNLLFDGIRVLNQANYNNDGLDPDGCTNVVVCNCYINAEDDALCLKGASGLPSQNILIENSTFLSTCNAFKIGTDTQGDFRNIIVRNVTLGGVPEGEPTIDGPEASTGITLATVDGGCVTDILMRDITINQARCPIFLRIDNRGRVVSGTPKPEPGTLSHIIIENVGGERNFRQGAFVSGIFGHPVEDIYINNYRIAMSGGGTVETALRTVPEGEKFYPDAHRFLRDGLPAYGFFVRHARGITIRNAEVTPVDAEERPVIANGGDVASSQYNGLKIH